MDFRITKIPEAVLQAMDITVKRIVGENREYEIYDSFSGNTGKLEETVSSFKRVVKLKDISLNKEKLNEDFLSISTKIESSEKELQVIMDYNKERFEKELKNLISVCQKNIEKTGIKAKIWIDSKYYAGKKIKVFYDSLDGKTQLSKVDEHILMIYLEMFEKELSGKGFLAINEEIDIHNYDFAEYSNMEKEKEASVTYAKMAFSICGEKPEIKMIEPFLSIYLVFTDKTYEKYEEEIMKLYYTFYEYFNAMGNNIFLKAPISQSIFNEYQGEKCD